MATNSVLAKQQLMAALERATLPSFEGIKMPAPEPDVRNSAVLILFGELDSVPASPAATDASPHFTPDLDVLLTRRSSDLRNHAGQIAFPGGGVEPSDADRAATALREAHEETGLDPSGVDVLGSLPDAHIPVSNYLVTPVLGWWRLPSDVAADRQESVEVFRVPVAELLAPDARGSWQLQYAGGTMRGPAFQLGPQFGGHVVWGFTAMLLSGIFESVGWEQPWDQTHIFEVSR